LARIPFQFAHDTAANWTANNPTLAQGEKGYETDTKKWKSGDGATAWTTLAYDSAGGGSGTVTTASVVSANGFAGTVSNPTTTPAITLTTSISGLLKGFASALVAATAGTDFQAPYAILSTFGALSNATGYLYNNGSGVLSYSSSSYTLPTATSSVLGGVKPDGTSILNSSGVISATAASVGALASGAQATDSAKLGGTAAASYALTANVPVVGTVVPLVNGTATIGASGKWADNAHIHPTDTGRQAANTNLSSIAALGNSAGYLYNNGSGTFSYATPGGGGTVTGVSTAAANNGVTATWSMASPTPALTIGLGAITPSSISTGAGTFTGTLLKSGTGSPAALTNIAINSYDTQNAFIQNNIQNLSSGVAASSDWIATCDTGTDSTGYVDMGVNSSGWATGTWTINGAKDGYVYCAGNNMAVGTDTAGKNLVLFTGGTLAANARLTLSDTTATFSTPVTGTSFNLITTLASATSPMNGTAAVGTSTTVARQDHVHPSDTSREPALGNPGTSGYVLASTTGGVRSWVSQGGGGATPGSINYAATGGSTAVTLQKWMDSSYLTPEAFGAAADGTTDDHDAINNAATTCASAGSVLRFTPGKTYYCGTTTINILCNVDGGKSTLKFAQDYTGTGVVIGSSSVQTQQLWIELPMVTCTHASYTSWSATPSSIGVQVYNCNSCHIRLAGIQYFAKGLMLAALGASYLTGYNDIYLGFFLDNKIHISIEPQDTTSWVNENRFYNGQLHHDSSYGTNQPFCYSLLIRQFGSDTGITSTATSTTITASTYTVSQAASNFTSLGFYVGCWVEFAGSTLNTGTYLVTAVGTTTLALASNSVLVNETTTITATTRGATFGNSCDNNTFLGVTMESVCAEAIVCIQGGQLNNFIGCRYEATTTQFFLCGMGTAAPTSFNSFLGGYINSGGDPTVLANGWTIQNRYQIGGRTVLSGSDSYGNLQLSNVGGIANACMTLWGVNNTGESTWAHPSGTGWMGQIGAYNWDLKSAAATVPMFRASSSIGGFYLGDGSTALNAYMSAISGNTGFALTGKLTVSSTINNVTLTAPASASTLTIASGSTFTLTGAYAFTFAIPGAYTYTFPSATSTLAGIGNANTWSSAQTFTVAPVLTASAGGTTDGQIWNDSTQHRPTSYNASLKTPLVGTMFAQTADGTNGAATAATSILGTGVGTKTIPASFFMSGKTIRVKGTGVFTTAATPGTATITLQLGAVVVATSAATTPTVSLTSKHFDFEFMLTCRSSTTIQGGGKIFMDAAIFSLAVPNTTTATIVNATAYAVDVQSANSLASGCIWTTKTCTIEVLE